jgi:lipopolysaccharide export LptBFGC system permease protein LptF
MSILDRYIARTFISSYVLLLIVLVGLIILFHMLVNIDELLQDSTMSTGQIALMLVDYYGHNLPLYYSSSVVPSSLSPRPSRSP